MTRKKVSLKTSFAFLIALIWLFGFGYLGYWFVSADGQTAEYRSATFGYQINYPKNWWKTDFYQSSDKSEPDEARNNVSVIINKPHVFFPSQGVMIHAKRWPDPMLEDIELWGQDIIEGTEPAERWGKEDIYEIEETRIGT